MSLQHEVTAKQRQRNKLLLFGPSTVKSQLIIMSLEVFRRPEAHRFVYKTYSILYIPKLLLADCFGIILNETLEVFLRVFVRLKYDDVTFW